MFLFLEALLPTAIDEPKKQQRNLTILETWRLKYITCVDLYLFIYLFMDFYPG